MTRPTPAMRAAMAGAPVGDDQFGEDPSVNALQDRVSELLEREAALWLPSGTMANQVALRALTRPGDVVVAARDSHIVWHETGGGGANAGVQFVEVGAHGAFTVEDLLAGLTPPGHVVLPPTTLVEVENTHNRAGGTVFPRQDAERVCAAARERGIATYLDGARLWNAAVASGCTPAELAAPFDLVSVAFSKGLGAPGGSMLAGPRALIERATRYRRMLGGAMRQVGILAAAGQFGLEHHMDRLVEDHANAALIGDRLRLSARVAFNGRVVRTNIVIFDLAEGAPDAETLVARARDRGVLVLAFGPRTIRAVTHLDVSRRACERAADVIAELVDE
jgi:threonine aldolase